jgi:site-specific recombinase XerC
MAAERGASNNTCQAYRRDLADFTGWMNQQGLSVEAATSHDIRNFLSALADRQLAASSSARNLRCRQSASRPKSAQISERSRCRPFANRSTNSQRAGWY